MRQRDEPGMIPTFLLEHMKGRSCHCLRWESQGGAGLQRKIRNLYLHTLRYLLDIQVETLKRQWMYESEESSGLEVNIWKLLTYRENKCRQKK